MDTAYYFNVFIPAHRELDNDAIKAVLTSALEGLGHRVEINSADDDDGFEDMLDHDSLRAMAEAGVHDFDDFGNDLILEIDDYVILVTVTRGDNANELASAYDENEGLSKADIAILEKTQVCVELFSEEEDPEHRYAKAMESIVNRFKQDYGALVIEGEV